MIKADAKNHYVFKEQYEEVIILGTYLNPGNNAFREAIDSEIFIDKTDMINYLNSVVKTKQKYVSVSRPRRFGKTMAADMLCAYYDRTADSRQLFEKCNIHELNKSMNNSEWDEYLGSFDVIRLVMTDFFKNDISIDKALERLQKLLVRELSMAYPKTDFFDTDDFLQSIQDVYADNHIQFVIIIDE